MRYTLIGPEAITEWALLRIHLSPEPTRRASATSLGSSFYYNRKSTNDESLVPVERISLPSHEEVHDPPEEKCDQRLQNSLQDHLQNARAVAHLLFLAAVRMVG